MLGCGKSLNIVDSYLLIVFFDLKISFLHLICLIIIIIIEEAASAIRWTRRRRGVSLPTRRQTFNSR